MKESLRDRLGGFVTELKMGTTKTQTRVFTILPIVQAGAVQLSNLSQYRSDGIFPLSSRRLRRLEAAAIFGNRNGSLPS